jgi:hypothetical protein
VPGRPLNPRRLTQRCSRATAYPRSHLATRISGTPSQRSRREDLPAALEEIALDEGNEALIITGTGDSFMDQIDGPSLGEIFKPAAWEKTRREGTKILQRLLDPSRPRSASSGS